MSSASRHKLPTLAAAELHAKLVEGIRREAYIATVGSISRKTAVADPRAGERVAQLAQGREKSIGQIGTMMMLESQLLS